ncbi:PENR2 protein [Paracoccidioides lutzii Pb01]|uniref:PENR2 protein n=1 Tax=Paracoccidioides lutzii (strain ATCC MYA-826 / Pb01) TaxID=502779 RepID=C1H976_PARBA|nr:PENR2 protein [Paracoccidioides lutzii Pb01]EEH36899.1 PENR2 protein [Paracoccidioides lutzii Pb01]
MSDQQLPSTDASTGSNKRKREMMDAGDGQRLTRSSHGQNSNGNLQGAYHPFDHGLPNTTELSQIDQQLLQHVGNQNGVSVSVADDNAMTAKAALAAHGSESKYPPPGPSFESNAAALAHGLTFGHDDVNVNVAQVPMGNVNVHGHSTAAAVYAAREAQNINPKPTVGSAEWHTIRKNNHKEVERRRRETINEGINEIAKMVPGCEKAKGSILQRAIHYISKLQEETKDMAARWDTANMTTNHALAEIGAQNTKLKEEVNRRGEVAAKWMMRCKEAGLEFEDYEIDEKGLGMVEVDDGQGEAGQGQQVQQQEAV